MGKKKKGIENGKKNGKKGKKNGEKEVNKVLPVFLKITLSRDADEAVYALNGRELGGNRVNVQHSKVFRET